MDIIYYTNIYIHKLYSFAEIAQLVEQLIEDHRVTSSSLVLSIFFHQRSEKFVIIRLKITFSVPIDPFLFF